MIFPSLNLETTLQVDDKTRFIAENSFAVSEIISDVLIEAETGSGFVSIYNSGDSDKWHLDWAYDTDGIKNVTVRVITDLGTKDKVYDVNVLTEAVDALYSTDNDLYPYEPEISNYLPLGKNSFKYAHRAAQSKILAYLDEQRIWKNNTERFDKFDILDKEEFSRWSLFQTLLIIFEGSQVSVGDLFQEKKEEYEKEMKTARSRGALRLDFDGDGNNDLPTTITSTRLVRR